MSDRVTDLVRVIGVDVVAPYTIDVAFSDGRRGLWDCQFLTEAVGPMVEPFKDPAFFAQVWVEHGALTWPNGYDWSAEALHADMAAAGALRFSGAVA